MLVAGMEATSSQVEQKAVALLQPWLSPEQAEQYSSYRYFEVIGSDTGKRYRIRHGRMMNVDELDSVGNKVCEWCFLPEGKLAAGDVMLAQKIALEAFESQALAVANRSSSRPLAPDGHCLFRCDGFGRPHNRHLSATNDCGGAVSRHRSHRPRSVRQAV
jgi:hypothetical protein